MNKTDEPFYSDVKAKSRLRAETHYGVQARESAFTSEAILLGRYLLSASPKQFVIERYCEAVVKKKPAFGNDDIKLWTFLKKNTWAIGIIDAGLAIIKPQCGIRNKILLMLAIIEATPDYSHLFLPKNRSFFYFLTIVFVGFRSVVKAVIGCVVITLLNLK